MINAADSLSHTLKQVNLQSDGHATAPSPGPEPAMQSQAQASLPHLPPDVIAAGALPHLRNPRDIASFSAVCRAFRDQVQCIDSPARTTARVARFLASGAPSSGFDAGGNLRRSPSADAKTAYFHSEFGLNFHPRVPQSFESLCRAEQFAIIARKDQLLTMLRGRGQLGKPSFVQSPLFKAMAEDFHAEQRRCSSGPGTPVLVAALRHWALLTSDERESIERRFVKQNSPAGSIGTGLSLSDPAVKQLAIDGFAAFPQAMQNAVIDSFTRNKSITTMPLENTLSPEFTLYLKAKTDFDKRHPSIMAELIDNLQKTTSNINPAWINPQSHALMLLVAKLKTARPAPTLEQLQKIDDAIQPLAAAYAQGRWLTAAGGRELQALPAQERAAIMQKVVKYATAATHSIIAQRLGSFDPPQQIQFIAKIIGRHGLRSVDQIRMLQQAFEGLHTLDASAFRSVVDGARAAAAHTP